MNPAAIIARKRNGDALAAEDMEAFVHAFVDGGVADYQMSAFLMAVYFRGMTSDETAALTRAMIASGDVLSFPDVPGRKVDKHSTGGVGDLVSLPLAPLVAAAGVPVPMISGRGLGHTGGTLDKLESIPGLRTDLSADEFRRVLAACGFAMGGQTARLVPADRRMYALRDVTATVESVPLIVSSILSKKIAEGAEAIVLDVKFGRGAFMASEDDARRLARELTSVSRRLGVEAVAFVTDMDQPLGRAAGNAVEVVSSLDCLRGEGPEDLVELIETLGAAMLCLGGVAEGFEDGVFRVRAATADGRGRERFRRMVAAQGGDPGAVDDPARLALAGERAEVRASRDGYVDDLDPRAIAETVLALGGGRRKTGDAIDSGVGVRIHRKRGERVGRGDAVLEILARDAGSARREAKRLFGAIGISERAPRRAPTVRALITADGEAEWTGAATWHALAGEHPDPADGGGRERT